MSEQERKNEVAIQGQKQMAVFSAVKNSIYPGAKDESVMMALDYCKAAGLDPMTKPVHLVPMSVKDGKTGRYEWRDVVMPGIELYRTKASRTKEHAGTTEPEFGPTIEKEFNGKDKDGKDQPPVKVSFPEWCRITVRRIVAGQIVEFTAKEYWLENYATQNRGSDIPNGMWQKRTFGQIAKCAEAQALRKGFPEIGAQPTADEMYGKTIESDAIDNTPSGMKPTVEPPRAKKSLGIYQEEAEQQNDIDTLHDWYKANEANFKKDLATPLHRKLMAYINGRKVKLNAAKDETTATCPDGRIVPISHCENGCQQREGCQSFDEAAA